MKIKSFANLSSQPASTGYPLILKKNKILNPHVYKENNGIFPPEMIAIQVYEVNSGSNNSSEAKSAPGELIFSPYNSIQILNMIKQGYVPYVKYPGCIGLFKYYGYDNNGQLFILFDNSSIPNIDIEDQQESQKSINNSKSASVPLNLSSNDPIWSLNCVFVNENGTWGQLSDYAPSSGSRGFTYRNNEGSEER